MHPDIAEELAAWIRQTGKFIAKILDTLAMNIEEEHEKTVREAEPEPGVRQRPRARRRS